MGLLDSLLGNAGEINSADAMADLARIFSPSESVELAYKLIRDMVVLTNYPCFRVKPRLRGPAQSGGDTSDQPGAPSRGRLAGGA